MVKFKVIESLDELSHFKPDVETFADIETQGLYINIRLIQVYQPATDPLIYIIDIDEIDLQETKDFLKPLWTIWQGCSYDFGTLNMTTERFDDTLYLAKIAYPSWATMKFDKGSKAFSLDTIVKRLNFEYLYEGLDKHDMQKAGFVLGAYLSQAQLRYAATDVYALSLIWQNAQFQRCRNVMAYKVDILNVKYAIQYQQNGLISHQPSVRKELDKIEDEINSNFEELNGVNCNSPKQVKEALGTEDSTKPTLIRLISEGNRLAELVYKQRRLLKRRTFLHSYNFPKVITRFNVAGAATGRFTSTGGDLDRSINAQQIPRDLQYIFNRNTSSLQGDSSDTVVIHADYSTAELRAACSIMKEPVMYTELKAGKDLHRVAAAMVLNKPESEVTKGERQKGKAINFGFIFGMSAPSFVEYAYVEYGVIFTLEEAKLVKYKYDNKYKMIAKYHRARWNDYKTIPVSTPLGHRNKARLGTDAINHATQGCIAETMKLAIHYLIKEYPEAIKFIYNIVHDAGYKRISFPKGTSISVIELWADRLVIAMKKGWVEMCKCDMLFYKDIPMPVEYSYVNPETGEYIEVEV